MKKATQVPIEELMTGAEVAAALRVNRNVPRHWANRGKIRSVRTLGGHRRYFRADVEAILRGETPERAS